MRFFDAHCDAAMKSYEGTFDFVTGDRRAHVDLPRLLAAGHCAQLFAVFAPARYYAGRNVRELAVRAVGTIHGWAAASDGRMQVVLGASDVVAASGTPIAALIGLEGADPLEGRADNLEYFFDLGVRLVIPAWEDNAFSGTSGETGEGLSTEGVRLVELAEALGVMVDVSHLSDTAFDQVLGLTRAPFVASHSNCRSLSPTPRNLTDAQIRALAGRGGVMGINLAPDFLDPDYLAAWARVMSAAKGASAAERQRIREAAGPRLREIPLPGLDRVAWHVKHAMQLGGEGCVGLGGDLDGISRTPEGIEGADSYPMIADALRQAGLTERQVELVCWRNMTRVFCDVLPQQ